MDKGVDEIYCPNCAKPIKKDAVVCPNCGVQVRELKVSASTGGAVTVLEEDLKREASGRATTWLIWSIVGLFICGIVLGILSVVQATNIKKILKPGDPGYGKALAAQIIGWFDIAGWIVAIIVSIASVASQY